MKGGGNINQGGESLPGGSNNFSSRLTEANGQIDGVNNVSAVSDLLTGDSCALAGRVTHDLASGLYGPQDIMSGKLTRDVETVTGRHISPEGLSREMHQEMVADALIEFLKNPK